MGRSPRFVGVALAGLFLACALAGAAAEEDGEEITPTADAPSEGRFHGFFKALGESFGVILATEIGDRTFFIAAIMAMRHSRFVVWFGAAGALVVMTVLSTAVGHVAPMLISRTYTQIAAAGCFLFFGIKMLREGLSISHAGASEELEEVEAELTKKVDDPEDDPEIGLRGGGGRQDSSVNKVLMQAFTLTFIAEWGDRSQIATIALVRRRARRRHLPAAPPAALAPTPRAPIARTCPPPLAHQSSSPPRRAPHVSRSA